LAKTYHRSTHQQPIVQKNNAKKNYVVFCLKSKLSKVKSVAPRWQTEAWRADFPIGRISKGSKSRHAHVLTPFD